MKQMGEKIKRLEHGIIDYNTLIDLAIKQAPRGEAGRLFQLDGVDLEQVKEIRIEFQNIISLEQLWPMKNISKLVLSHNCIEKISKLDDLIELRELDLSFNQISTMKGLNNLIKLEVLILSGNKIEQIHGIDNLDKLEIFSIADNKISNWEHVIYLRKLKNLRSLNLQGNSCTEQENYIDYVIAFIPQLVYFSYRMITLEERTQALTKYRLLIAKIEESDTNIQRALCETQTIEQIRATDLTAFVENLKGNDFFNLLFENNKDNLVISNKILHQNFDTILEHYKTNICKLSNEIYQFGKDQEVKRVMEINTFQDTIMDECNAMKMSARRLMNDIEEFRDKISMEEQSSKNVDIISSVNIETIKNITGKFTGFLSSKWTQLMYNEVVLHQQIQDLIESFRQNMSGMIDGAITYTKNQFALMKEAESNYNEKVISEIGDFEDINFRELMERHDHRLNLINSRENTMLEKITSWFTNYMLNLETNEDARHRSRILEISHFFQSQKETLENSFDLSNLNVDKNLETEVKALINE